MSIEIKTSIRGEVAVITEGASFEEIAVELTQQGIPTTCVTVYGVEALYIVSFKYEHTKYPNSRNRGCLGGNLHTLAGAQEATDYKANGAIVALLVGEIAKYTIIDGAGYKYDYVVVRWA